MMVIKAPIGRVMMSCSMVSPSTTTTPPWLLEAMVAPWGRGLMPGMMVMGTLGVGISVTVWRNQGVHQPNILAG